MTKGRKVQIVIEYSHICRGDIDIVNDIIRYDEL